MTAPLRSRAHPVRPARPREPLVRVAAGVVVLVLLAAAGAGRADAADRPPAARDAPPRAALLGPVPPLAVGVVGEVVVAVRTPPGHRVAGTRPERLAGAEIVRSTVELQEQPGGGWLHRTRIRVRPLADGPLQWPALDIAVTSPEGETIRLALPERALPVDAVLGEGGDEAPRLDLRAPPPAGREGPGFASGVAAGATIALAGFALHAAWRRRAAGRAAPPSRRPDDRHPTAATRPGGTDPLAAARDALPDDPRRAAGLAVETLRMLASERSRVDLRAATSEELRATRPASLPPAVHDTLVDWLARADALRFAGGPVDEHAAARLLADATGLAERLRGGGGRSR